MINLKTIKTKTSSNSEIQKINGIKAKRAKSRIKMVLPEQIKMLRKMEQKMPLSQKIKHEICWMFFKREGKKIGENQICIRIK